MPHDLVQRWAALNDLTPAPEPFGLHELADDPPAGADQVQTLNAENATHLVDEEGYPAAVAFHSFGGHWVRELRDLVRWLKLSPFAPPGHVEEGDRMFLVVGKADAAEPQWLPEQR